VAAQPKQTNRNPVISIFSSRYSGMRVAVCMVRRDVRKGGPVPDFCPTDAAGRAGAVLSTV